MKIKSVKAIEILDSRGNPTLRCFIVLDDGSIHSSSVPSGASTGSHEAVELRDHDEKRYGGMGVQKAIININTTIATQIVGTDIENPEIIDEKLIAYDGTDDKSKLGANSLLAVSLSIHRAAAYSAKKPLWMYLNQKYFENSQPKFPSLMLNVVNGGKHASWNFDIQEFMLIPKNNIPSLAIKTAAEIYQAIARNLKQKKLSTLVGDEGGFSPTLSSNEEVFQLIIDSAETVGFQNNRDYGLGIDAAATEFYENGKYILKKDNREITAEDLINYYLDLHKKYQVISYEDPFQEDDWVNFGKLTKLSGAIVVGDDLLVTNTKRMANGYEKQAVNAVIIKPNQIGTVKETVNAIKLAKTYGWKLVISHRSGETEDSFIADIAYASSADYLKSGAPCRSDRLSKYNRLLEIENNF